MLFISSREFFSFLRYLHFFLDFSRYVGQWLDKRTKVNFIIYNATNWNTNRLQQTFCQISQKVRQSNNKIWPVIKM